MNTAKMKDMLNELDKRRSHADAMRAALRKLECGDGQSGVSINVCGVVLTLTDHTPENSWYGKFRQDRNAMRYEAINIMRDIVRLADGAVEGQEFAIRNATKEQACK